jgi:hypothetical protein
MLKQEINPKQRAAISLTSKKHIEKASNIDIVL